MLGKDEFLEWCASLGLPERSQAVIHDIRSSPPSRLVQSKGRSVSARYPSQKMGVTIQAESHRVELAGVLEYEYDDNVLEFFDQPHPIKLLYEARNGRNVGVLHTPDFFVLRRGAVGWEEWKSEKDLEKLAEKMPNRYLRDADGRWRCPPGECYAQQFGFYYRVRSSAEINWCLQRNLIFLEDYLRGDCPPVSEDAKTEILSMTTHDPGIKLSELVARVIQASADDIYTLMVTKELFVDLYAAPLAEAERVRVFPDEWTARACLVVAETSFPPPISGPHALNIELGATFLWRSTLYTLINFDERDILLRAEKNGQSEIMCWSQAELLGLVKQGEVTGISEKVPVGMSPEVYEIIARTEPKYLKVAHERYELIKPYLEGQPSDFDTVAERTFYRWVSLYRVAEQTYGCGFVGLIPRRTQQGNYNKKLQPRSLELLKEYVKRYETLKQQGKFAVHSMYRQACEDEGVVAACYKTFSEELQSRPQDKQTRNRKGPRAANQYQPFYWELSLTTPRHGDRSFEIGHIDHTQLDTESVCSRTGRNLGRPWASFFMDAFSRRLLAIYLTFDPPSYRSCMMLVRECVRRHGRLPQFIVVDGGKEFHGTYFETLLALCSVTKKTRPGAKPRYGSVCERLFGTSNTQFAHNLMGNTQIMKDVRQVTKSVNPAGLAIWPIDRLYARLCEWAYEVYDTIDHPALGQSPREAFAMGMARSGARSHRLIPYDDNFIMLTLPTPPHRTAKVHPTHGVRIRYVDYWSDAFRDPRVAGTKVPVRYDPYDAGVAYAFVKGVTGRWVQCISEHYACFKGRSEREIQLATDELHRQDQLHAKNYTTITARKLAAFLSSLEAEEILLAQRLRDAGGRDVLAIMQGNPTDVGGHNLTLPQTVSTEDGDAEQAWDSGLADPMPSAAVDDDLPIYGDYLC
jgi:putative transposase